MFAERVETSLSPILSEKERGAFEVLSDDHRIGVIQLTNEGKSGGIRYFCRRHRRINYHHALLPRARPRPPARPFARGNIIT